VDETIIEHFERKIDKPERDTIGALETALEALGAVFIDENGEGIGVRLKFTESEAGRISRMEMCMAVTKPATWSAGVLLSAAE
jgi:hypothetical protein